MSALLAYSSGEAVHVVSDACATMPDGAVGSIGSKIHRLPELGAVLVIMGQEPLGRLFVEWLNARKVGSFAELEQCLADELRPFEAAYLERYAAADADYLAVLAGWGVLPGRKQCAGRIVYVAGSGNPRHAPGLVLRDGGTLFTAGPRARPPAALVELHRARLAGARPRFSPEEHALPFFEAMRRNVSQGFSVVGGFLEEVTITPGAISSRLVKVWPDRVGRRIEVMQHA